MTFRESTCNFHHDYMKVDKFAMPWHFMQDASWLRNRARPDMYEIAAMG